METAVTNYNPASVAIIGGSGVEIKVAEWGVPVLIAPTGTMANNGAVTLGTALGRTYVDCFMAFAAGAIAAGVPAVTTWYYVQMSSATVGVVFNNPIVPGAAWTPTIPASPTAFATTGPGAYTGVIAEVQGPTVSVPGNSLGANGRLIMRDQFWQFNNTAGVKTPRLKFGGTTYFNPGPSTQLNAIPVLIVQNAGKTNVQLGFVGGNYGSIAVISTNMVSSAIDTTAAQNAVFSLQIATATDYLVLENGSVAFVA